VNPKITEAEHKQEKSNSTQMTATKIKTNRQIENNIEQWV